MLLFFFLIILLFCFCGRFFISLNVFICLLCLVRYYENVCLRVFFLVEIVWRGWGYLVWGFIFFFEIGEFFKEIDLVSKCCFFEFCMLLIFWIVFIVL